MEIIRLAPTTISKIEQLEKDYNIKVKIHMDKQMYGRHEVSILVDTDVYQRDCKITQSIFDFINETIVETRRKLYI